MSTLLFRIEQNSSIFNLYQWREGRFDHLESLDSSDGISSLINFALDKARLDSIEHGLDVSAVINFMPGNYVLESRINIPRLRGRNLSVEFNGCSNGNTASAVLSSINDFPAVYLFNLHNTEEITFRDLSFKDVLNSTNTAGNPLGLIDVFGIKNSHRVSIISCSFYNISGAVIRNTKELSTSISLINCQVYFAGSGTANITEYEVGGGAEKLGNRPVFSLNHTSDLLISGCKIENSGSSAIGMSSVSKYRIINNTIRRSNRNIILGQGHGIFISNESGLNENNSDNSIISGNLIEENGTIGIEISRGSNLDDGVKPGHRGVIISNNIITGNGYHRAREILDSTHPSGKGSYSPGLYLGASEAIVKNNLFKNNKGGGIRIPDVGEITNRSLIIEGNQFISNGINNDRSLDRSSGITFLSPDRTVYNEELLLSFYPSIRIFNNIFQNRSGELKEELFDNLDDVGDVSEFIQTGQLTSIFFDRAIIESTDDEFYLPNFIIENNTFCTNVDYQAILFRDTRLVKHIIGIIVKNDGYRTENTGIFQLRQGRNYWDIPHGLELPIPPILQGFTISAYLEDTTLSMNSNLWIDSDEINLLTFRIRLSGPGVLTDNLNILWHYENPRRTISE